MIVWSSATKPFQQVDRVGVAIMNAEPGQMHTAFLYRLDAAPAQLVHLGWHHMLIRNTPDDRYMWADVAELEAEDRRHLASYLSVVGQGSKIPYGLNAEGIEFDPTTGALKPHPAGHGATCATFILAVFRALGHEVLNEDEWPVGRLGDEEWQTRIVTRLANAAPQHAAAVAADLPCVRFRPEEVVGSSATAGWSHSFPTGEKLGGDVLDDMASAAKLLHGPPQP